MVCGSFRESAEKQILLDDADERALRHVMDLACGCPDGVQLVDVREMVELGLFADRYEMAELAGVVEEAIVRSLTVESCGEVLRWSGGGIEGGPLPLAVAAARKLGLEHFAELSRSRGFGDLSEDVLCGLVGDDDMATDEEVLLEGVVGWIKGGDEEGRGVRALREIRYGQMEASRLSELVLKEEMLAGRQGAMLRELASEAVLVQHAPASVREGREYRLLGSRAFSRRKGRGVAWGDYTAGRLQHRVVRDKQDANCLCEGDGQVDCGLNNGTIVVWDASTLKERQVLKTEGEVCLVNRLTLCGDVVVSGHRDGSLRVWNKATGRCDQDLQGHTDVVTGIASWERYLVSGSLDQTIKVWEMGAG